MSTSTKLSIIILNHRADHLLERSLQSAQFAEDVLIIDNNSQADWQALSNFYRFRVLPHSQQISDWSAIRNQAMMEAAHDWVFFFR